LIDILWVTKNLHLIYLFLWFNRNRSIKPVKNQSIFVECLVLKLPRISIFND